MLIKKDNIVINLDNVKEFCIEDYHSCKICFLYSNQEIRKIGFKNKTEIERVFNEIIANYNSGKKVYVIGWRF